jgi:hypothetical protein
MENITTPLVRKADRDLYTQIESSRLFQIEGKKSDLTQGKIFALAVAQGFASGDYDEMKEGDPTIFYGRWSYITENTDIYRFIQSIAVAHKKSIKVLNEDDKLEVFKIAQAYANGGIHKLHHLLFSKDEPDFDKKLESQLMSL